MLYHGVALGLPNTQKHKGEMFRFFLLFAAQDCVSDLSDIVCVVSVVY